MSAPTPWIPEGCPWSELNHLAPPNVKWCEASLCAWITEPANTWSNLIYFVIALVIYRESRKTRSSLNRNFYLTLICAGACSFIYHATNNYYTQILDFMGVYSVVISALVANCRRLGWVNTKNIILRVWVVIFGLTLGTVAISRLGVPFQATTGILIGLVLVTEGLARTLKRESLKAPLRALQLAVALTVMGVVFMVLDLSRMWCEPSRHWIQGHAVWHICAAFAALALFRYLKRLDDALA